MADVKARVVSMPSCELFEQQSESYRNSALPDDVKARMSVEQAGFFGWAYYTGLEAPGVGMRTFGASAPLKELQKKFGFTPEKVVETAKEIIARTR